MEILINQTIGAKKEDVFGLFDNGSIMVKDDKETLIASRTRMKDAIDIIDHWLDRYK